MKKYLFSFVLILFLTIQTEAQFIIAGQHGAKDYYAVPDTTVPYGNCDNYSYSYLIDMNGDGIMDFELTRFCNEQPSVQESWNEISSLNNNEIAFGYIDSTSCYGPMAHAFNDMDTINNNRIWTDSSLNMFFSASAYPGYFCLDNIILSDTGSAYLGVRVFLAQDTLYGWIKIFDYYTLTIVSYACNLGVTGINENQNSFSIKLSPNPATNQLTIHSVGWSSNGVNTSSFRHEAVTVSVMNVLGQKAHPPTPSLREGEDALIDVSGLAAGVYFVEIVSGKGRWVGRFVKE